MNSGNKAASAKAPLTGVAPSTEEIDDEWGAASEPKIENAPAAPAVVAAESQEPAPPSVISSPPITDEVDSGWLSESESESEPEERRSALESPIFPADPAIPLDLAPQAKRIVETTVPTKASGDVPRAAAAAAAPLSSASSPAKKAEAQHEPTGVTPRDLAPPQRVATAGHATSRSRPLLPVLGLLLLLGGVVWFLRGNDPAPPLPEAARAPEPRSAPAAAPPAASAPDGVENPGQAASADPVPAAPVPAQSGPSREVEPPAAPAAAPAAAGEAPLPSASPASGEKTTVVLKVRPAHARIFRHGKEVGPAPVRIELGPGERRFYEVGADGYMTRKVIVDGSKLELTIGLRAVEPMSGAPASTAR